jgi:chromosome segregation ATPase
MQIRVSPAIAQMSLQAAQEALAAVSESLITAHKSYTSLQGKNGKLAQERSADHARLSSSEDCLEAIHVSYARRPKEKDEVLAENARLQAQVTSLLEQQLSAVQTFQRNASALGASRDESRSYAERVSVLEGQNVGLQEKVVELEKQLATSKVREGESDKDKSGKNEAERRAKERPQSEVFADCTVRSRPGLRSRSQRPQARFSRYV